MSIVILVRELRNHTLRNGFGLRLVRHFASSEKTKPEEEEIEDNEVKFLMEEKQMYSEDEIDILRNKSKLYEKQYNKLHQKAPSLSEDEKLVFPLRDLRKLYAEYGSSSNINVGVLWPSKEELALDKERERVAYPDTVLQMIEKEKKIKEEEEQAILKRQKDIANKMLKLEGWKNEVRENVAKQEAAARAAKEKREQRIEEVRQMFGFRIDPKDPKFQEALEKKEKEEKKAAKAAKKLKKQQMKLDSIRKMVQQASEQAGEKTSAQGDEQSERSADSTATERISTTEGTSTAQPPTEGTAIAQPPIEGTPDAQPPKEGNPTSPSPNEDTKS